jgi:hypothetical protein
LFRYKDENREDSVDIHPRRFEPGICGRNFSLEMQEGASQLQLENQQVAEDEY